MLIDFLDKILVRNRKNRSLMNSLLIDISAILLWRGIWGLLDLFIFPGSPALSFVSSAVLGVGLLVTFKFLGKI